jgi:hypothetical protein
MLLFFNGFVVKNYWFWQDCWRKMLNQHADRNHFLPNIAAMILLSL